MIILIKTELYKLKRSYMFLMCIAGAMCAPFLNWLIELNYQSNTGIKADFSEYMIQTNMLIAIVIGTLLYGLFTTYVFEREFSEDMYKHLLTVPVSKFSLLTSKIVVIMIGLLILTLTSYISALILSLISGFSNINSSSIAASLVLFLKAYLAFVPLMIPVILVTFISRSFVAPIAFSIVAEIILFVVMQSKYIALYPWSAPIMVGTGFGKEFAESLVASTRFNVFSAVCLGILSFAACLTYLNHKEII